MSGDACVIDVREDLDIASASELESAIVVAECGSSTRIVVSFETCRYCDSTGLAVLIRSKKRLGERLAIVVPPGCRVERIFTVTALRDALAIYDSVADATNVPAPRESERAGEATA